MSRSRTKLSLVALAAVLGSLVVIPVTAVREEGPRSVWVEPSDTWATVASACGSTAAAIRHANYLATNAALRSNSWLDCPPLVVPTTTTTALPPVTTTAPPTTTTLAPTTTTTTTLPPTTTSTTTVPGGAQFVSTFDTQASMSSFRWELADGRSFDSQQGLTWRGDHDTSCSTPDTTRTLSGPNDGQPYQIPMVFNPVQTGQAYWCPNGGGHMMTSFNTGGYSHLDFMPNQILSNVNEICWDVNATDLGHRKWLQVAIVPEAEFQTNGGGLFYIHPGFGGPGGPAESWSLPVRNGTALLSFTLGNIEAFGSVSGANSALFDGNADKMARLVNCITDTGSGVRVTQAVPGGGTRVTNLQGGLPNGQVRVIFQDASYNPDKAVQESSGPAVSNAYTWHWDNIVIR